MYDYFTYASINEYLGNAELFVPSMLNISIIDIKTEYLTFVYTAHT
jgi:hypothetical protein